MTGAIEETIKLSSPIRFPLWTDGIQLNSQHGVLTVVRSTAVDSSGDSFDSRIYFIDENTGQILKEIPLVPKR